MDKEFRVYNGGAGAIMSEQWEILEQWGAPATPAEILEWAHENALRANEAYDRTKRQYHAALAFAKAARPNVLEAVYVSTDPVAAAAAFRAALSL